LLGLFILSFAVALGVGYVILRFRGLHARFSGDVALRGSHKIHALAVPRIGGFSIFIGWLAGLAFSSYAGELSVVSALSWAACLLPAFAAGLAEDVTKRVPPVTRLLFSFLTAALAYTFLHASVDRVDLPQIDFLLSVPALSFIFTLVAIGGVAHAVNIIDGLNGLSSGVCLIALFAVGYVAFNVGDSYLVLMCGLGAAAILGFRVWNYPSGQLFCGDGGAYFVGAYVAVISTLLVKRHPEISAWFPVILVLYPIWETLFSAYRRRVLRGLPASMADKLHMHTLFYKRARQRIDNSKAAIRSRRNSDASVWMMMFAVGSAVPAVLWWSHTSYLLAALFAYISVYLAIYRRLVRFGFRAQPRGRKVSVRYIVGRVAALGRIGSRRSMRQGPKLP